MEILTDSLHIDAVKMPNKTHCPMAECPMFSCDYRVKIKSIIL